MPINACLAPFLACIWETIGPPVVAWVQTAVADSLRFLRERVVAEIRNPRLFRGNQVVPPYTGDLVGMDEILGYQQKIADYLKDDRVGVIGIFGMAGVGKTTLLERIREIGAPGLDVVIWVTVSKDPNLLKIRKSISCSLNLSAEELDAPEQQAEQIINALLNKRFLLLLDDVWDKVELKDVGIPEPTAENKCKVILTTRSEEVCRNMGAKKLLEVKVLNESESWELFRKKLGSGVDLGNPDINQIAKDVAHECDGLPLALITVGGAMAYVRSHGGWMEALRQLRGPPNDLPGMTDKVLSLLLFCFNELRDETLECLLYCCLYPEDSDIPVEQIIEYWVGEGFRDTVRSNSVFEARNWGRGEINKLKKICLLQESAKGEDHVKMHDVVRELCLWLTRGAFLVLAGLNQSASELSWGDKKRISLMYNDETKCLPRHVPACPNLHTLLCNGYWNCRPLVIRTGFFKSITVLRVLDLSFTSLKELPEDVRLLKELRYLNLELTEIIMLPKGLGKLPKLNQLNLNDTPHLRHIPREAIPALTRLRVLSMRYSAYEFGPTLSSLPWDKLEELQLSVSTLGSLEALLKSCIQCRSVHLEIQGHLDNNLQNLMSSLCSFASLRKLEIYWCNDIPDLAWVQQLPSLEDIQVVACEGIKELLCEIGGGGGAEARECDSSSVRSLKRLTLRDLPELTSISSRPMLFPSLEYLHVMDCPQLKKLPLTSAQKIKRIECRKKWWEKLEWDTADGGSVQSRFLPHVLHLGY